MRFLFTMLPTEATFTTNKQEGDLITVGGVVAPRDAPQLPLVTRYDFLVGGAPLYQLKQVA